MPRFFITFLISAVVTCVAFAQPSPESDEESRQAFKQGLKAFNEKQFDKAVEALTQIPELGGFLSLYKHWFLGQAYLELQKYELAEVEFMKVVQGQPSPELQYHSRFFMAEAAFRQRNYKQVIERLLPLEKKWRRSHRFPEVLYRLMEAEFKLGRIGSTCKRVRQLYSDHPAHPHVMSWNHDLSNAQIDGEKLPCKLEAADFPDRVRRLQLSGEAGKAHQEIVEKLAKAPAAEKLRLDLILANFLISEGSVDDALNLLIRYYPTQKQNMGYLMLLGKAAARSGEYQTAVGAYERASALSPNSRKGREALFFAAFLSYQFQDYDGAVRKFQQFAKANPRSGLAKDAQWHLAWLQYLRNDFKGALARFVELKKTLGTRSSSHVLMDRLVYWTAMSLVRLNRTEEARTHFDSIVARNAYSYYGLAAQARLATFPTPKIAKGKIDRGIASLKPAAIQGADISTAEEEKESEEDIAETESAEAEAPLEEPPGEDGIRPSNFKDPKLRARIDVASALIQLGLNDLARWELWEVERRTSNPQYLRQLITAYEKIGSYNRAATIAELNFAREREAQGLEQGRALWTAMFPQAFKNFVTRSAREFGVPQEWSWAIMRTESMYKADVISPVGAKGLMQLMPYTARNLTRLRGEASASIPNLLEPEINVRLGTQYLARLQEKFKGQLTLVAAAYNAGPHRVEGWLVNFGHLENDEFIEHIPFLETRNYVKKVHRHHTLYRRIYAKDLKPVETLARSLGVPIPSKASTRESWDSI